jgi:hypothetical protein
MAVVTDNIVKRVTAIARKKAIHDWEDCLQEGLLKVLEMPEGQKESYYVKGAEFRIRDYLKKERLHKCREISLSDNAIEDLNYSRYFTKKTDVPDYDNADFDDNWSQNDQTIQRWYNGDDISRPF